MKVYIVTRGMYSDYKILKVFLSEELAEKYVSLVDTDNDLYQIGEYDTCDDLDSMKTHFGIVSLEWSPTGDHEKVYTYVSPYEENEFSDQYDRTEYHHHNIVSSCSWIEINRTFNLAQMSEEQFKEKYTKVAYDLKAYCMSLEAEGFSVKQINEMIKER